MWNSLHSSHPLFFAPLGDPGDCTRDGNRGLCAAPDGIAVEYCFDGPDGGGVDDGWRRGPEVMDDRRCTSSCTVEVEVECC